MSGEKILLSPCVLIQMLLVVVLIPFLPLLISGRWGWWEAWTYALLCVLGFVASRALAARRHPDLLAERSRFMQHENTKPWDRVLAPLVGIGSGVIPLVAGLDARFGWSAPVSLAAKIAALLLILAGFALSSYALITNRFFSGMVRIQTERGHKVVSSGPYRWVRHPGYAGAMLVYLPSAILLGSWWALLPAALASTVLILRTALEDRTLQAELPGYAEYARRTRYRLLPGVW
jgi:protein-S-isoprenylcysteine O-methyltransferase Ste14